MSTFQRYGNVLHCLNIGSSVVFATCVAMGRERLFDANWAMDGFCVVNRTIPYQTSHDMCLYVDVALSVMLCAVYFGLREKTSSAAKDLVFPNIMGVLAHGAGHGILGKSIRDGVDQDTRSLIELARTEGWTAASNFAVYAFFWVFLLKAAAAQNMKWKHILATAAGALAVGMFIPSFFNFTYVQTVLFMVFSLDQLFVENKSVREYMLYPLIVSLPLNLLGWLESTQCSSSLVQSLYGHVMYDAYIPISITAFYIIATLYHQQSNTQKLKRV